MARHIAYLPADDARRDPPAQELAPRGNRYEIELRRDVRFGWIAIAAGVILPVVALWGALRGWQLRRIGHPQGTPMFLLAWSVFAARVALYFIVR